MAVAPSDLCSECERMSWAEFCRAYPIMQSEPHAHEHDGWTSFTNADNHEGVWRGCTACKDRLKVAHLHGIIEYYEREWEWQQLQLRTAHAKIALLEGRLR
jgi:hypothetical protein